MAEQVYSDTSITILDCRASWKVASIGTSDTVEGDSTTEIAHDSKETPTMASNENAQHPGLSISKITRDLTCTRELRKPVSVGDTVTTERLREFRRRHSGSKLMPSSESRDLAWRGDKFQTVECVHLSPVRLTRPIKLQEIQTPRRRRSAFQAPAPADLATEARTRRASTSLLPTRGLSAPIPIPFRDCVNTRETESLSTSTSVSPSTSSSSLVSSFASGGSPYFRLPKEMFSRRRSTSPPHSLRARMYASAEGMPSGDGTYVAEVQRNVQTAGSGVIRRHRRIEVVHEEPTHTHILNRHELDTIVRKSPVSESIHMGSNSPSSICPRRRYTQSSGLAGEMEDRERGNMRITESENPATVKITGRTPILSHSLPTANRSFTISETTESVTFPVKQIESSRQETNYHDTGKKGMARGNHPGEPGRVFLISQDIRATTKASAVTDHAITDGVSKAESTDDGDSTNSSEGKSHNPVSDANLGLLTHIVGDKQTDNTHDSISCKRADETKADIRNQACSPESVRHIHTSQVNTSDRRAASVLNLASPSSTPALHTPNMSPCLYSNENIQYIQVPANNSTPFWHTQAQLPNQDAITKSAFVQTPDRHSVAVATESDRAQFKFTDSSRREVFESFARKHTLNIIETAVVRVFQRKPLEVTIFFIQEHVRRLVESDLAQLLAEFLKYKLLKKGMVILREPLRALDGQPLLAELAIQWEYFFTTILPWLHAAFLPLQSNEWKMRYVALVEFRDTILFKTKFEESILAAGIASVKQMEQMLLVLQSIYDSFIPSRNDVRVERLLAQLMPPFLGKQQFYTGDERFTTESLPSVDEDAELSSPTSPVSPVRFGHTRNISLESARWIIVPGDDPGQGVGNQLGAGNIGRRHSFAVK